MNNHRTVVCAGRTVNPLTATGFAALSFTWQAGRFTPLPLLPNAIESLANDINDEGVVVGRCLPAFFMPLGADPACVWRDGEVRSLGDLIDPAANLILTEAVAINNAGQILCSAYVTDAQGFIVGHSVSVLLTPTRQPVNAADLDADGLVDAKDLGILLSNWSIPPGMPGCKGAKSCPADLNSDGLVNGLDLGILLVNWTIR